LAEERGYAIFADIFLTRDLSREFLQLRTATEGCLDWTPVLALVGCFGSSLTSGRKKDK